MKKNKMKSAISIAFAVFLASVSMVNGQATGDGSPVQRLEVMRQKLDTIRKSASSASSVLEKEEKPDKNAKTNVDSPVGRLRSIEKEAERLSSEVSSLRGKVDRSEKYDSAEIKLLETAVSELQIRADTVQTETAAARATATTDEGKSRDVKKKKKFLGIFGGKGNDEYDELIGTVTPGRDRELFVTATREVRKKKFDVGRLLFQTIITTYSDSPYLPMSKLAVADSFYLEGSTASLIQAVAAYQDWLTFFPTHPLADRVVLKISEAEMRQVGLPDRDATHAKRAETRLKALLQSYPRSALKGEAEKRLVEVQNNLGTHNMLIANFYYGQSVGLGKGGLKGAQSRYREILDKYPNFGNMDEVLFKLANTYMLEEETDQAVRYFQRIVRDYPNSNYIAESKKQLELIGATIPATNPERVNWQPPEDASFFQNFKNQFFGVYPMTIDKNGVLMTKEFDQEKFELIDQIIENQGDILVNQIPNAFTTVISQRQAAPVAKPQQNQQPK